ncbi:MAG: FHA domain-containing protein [Myxococcales bacterium]|nr:FHA domain-containing protein [Myxococcales bacterium]MDD9967979.1 FHA domain-containing protein [Myxococcales bacterium]
METLVFVEVMRHAQVHYRVAIDALPATIGRAYDNQVIIDDPFVAPNHARLEQGPDGELLLVDAASDFEGEPRSVVISPRDGLTCSLGHTQIRIRTPAFMVPPMRRQRVLRLGIDRLLARPGHAWGVLLLSALVLLMRSYLSSTDDFVRSRFGVITAAAAVVLVWSGLWAFGTRLVSHRFRYLGHLTAATSTAAVLLTLASGLGYLEFLLPDNLFVSAATLAFDGLGIGVLLAAHMLVAGVTSVQRLLWAFGGSVALAAVLFAVDGGVEGEDRALPIAAELKPVPTAAIPTRRVDSFFREARKLQTRVDRAALD